MTNSIDKVEDIVGRLFFMEADWRKLSDLEHEATCKAAVDLIQSQQALIEEMREGLRKVGIALEFEDKSAVLRSGVRIGELIVKAKALSQKE